jgi:Bacterial regulatory proteins, tetR family.
MAAKEIIFPREMVGREALDLVSEQGWSALSARAVAGRLSSSVGPIYSAFGSMKELEHYVLDEIAEVFDAFIARARGGDLFLDMGIGMACFARDEPRLYCALVEESVSRERFESYKASLQERYFADTAYAFLMPERLSRVFERMWLFSLGFASALVHGYAADRSDEGIADLMRSQGGIVIYGEAAGFGERDQRVLRAAWSTLFHKEE